MTYQDTKEAPCTILEGPWSVTPSKFDEPYHSGICTLYGGGKVLYVHGPEWSYGHRWQDPTLFEELAEMIRQAPEVRKERDELLQSCRDLLSIVALQNGNLWDDINAIQEKARLAINNAEDMQ